VSSLSTVKSRIKVFRVKQHRPENQVKSARMIKGDLLTKLNVLENDIDG
jgi:hypothetical protein